MKSSILIEPGKEYMYPEPGKIHQVDYRVFKFTIELGFEDRIQHGYAITELIKRVNEYTQARPALEHSTELVGGIMILQFAKLDDARMFMLSFSDVLETKGYKYE